MDGGQGRRWNGWGAPGMAGPLPETTRGLLTRRIGPGRPLRDATIGEVLARVPPSRLAAGAAAAWVTDDPGARLRHAHGQSFPDLIALRCNEFRAFPDLVAFPGDDGEVREGLRLAADRGCVVVPYGGGTSVVGGVTPPDGDRPVVTLDLSRLSGLRELDEVSGLARFGAGTAGPAVERALRAHGHTLGHYPQSFQLSTLGGWVATRSSGQQSLGFGRIEQLFAGGRLVGPTGTLDLPAFPASAAGPDLRHLVLGSEGRLGVLTEARVRVRPLPDVDDVHGIFLPGWEQGVELARALARSPLPLSLVRLSTPDETEATLALAAGSRSVAVLSRVLAARGLRDGRCLMLAGLHGTGWQVRTATAQLLAMVVPHGGVAVGRGVGRAWKHARFSQPYLRDALWEAGYGVDTMETATTWRGIPELVTALESALHGALAGLGERVHVGTHLSHVYPSGSSVYTTVVFRLGADGEQTRHRWRLLKAAAGDAIVHAGGTISHQHGVGRDHRAWLPAEKGEIGMTALRAVAERLDPAGMMSPGVLL